MAEDRRQAIRAALAAIPGSPGDMPAETCIETTLLAEGWHLVSGADLGIARHDPGRPLRCPRCHAGAAARAWSWQVHCCCSCGTRFARWPALARFLPFARNRCAEHGEARRG